MKVVTLLFCRRPQYATRVLRRLSQCAGIGGYHLVILLDGPPMPSMRKLCDDIKFAPKEIIQAPRNAGCNASTRAVLRKGFERSDYVIHVEEDICLSADALQYFEWASQFGSDQELLTVSAFNNPKGCGPYQDSCPPEWNHLAGKIGGFTCWGWATWRDRWEKLDAFWTTGTDKDHSWDIRVEEYRRTHKLAQLMPYVSRAANIGKDGGVHRGAYMFKFWAGDNRFQRKSEFKLV